jgi:glutamate-1-semialdehyde 2,1-aminomutase
LRSYKKSSELYERAKRVLAGGVSSGFRSSESPHPLFFARAEGARMWDVDGNESLDFTLSQGPMILGHCNPIVHEAVCRADARGQVYAAQHLEELELAEALQQLIPCAELMRFCVSGSEAAQAALRVARAYTRRPKFIKFEGHYHGWLDSVAFSVNPPLSAPDAGPDVEPVPWSSGIPAGLSEDVIVLPWNDLDVIEKVLQKKGPEIAAMITEPIMCNNGCVLPEPGFLEGIRAACDNAGCVLIFDEIITGFRVALGGAQTYFKVTPDLAILGKAMGSGLPISALVGKRKLMEVLTTGKAIQAGTMNAQNASVAAALSTVTELKKRSSQLYPEFGRLAGLLRSALQTAAMENGHSILTQGVGPVFHMGFTRLSHVKNYRETLRYDTQKYQLFAAGMRQRGIRLILRGLWYLSAAHTEADIDSCIEAARATFSEMKSSE